MPDYEDLFKQVHYAVKLAQVEEFKANGYSEVYRLLGKIIDIGRTEAKQ